ncbi:acyl dehydratase [Roseomonas terrae]|jgi:acyl dehydratase|uniref:Acyl dehydratase n=1 Tax=Neoroseomonas terrae TaxID=424799 RepID=A0ABS5EKR5_9PROT|nr:MaoC/PaaZ C-terminal domain-containing protein [Neoroseomonas terrae]MBR0651207.1 acyl dehydratase [Neoroseomonas terrae]
MIEPLHSLDDLVPGQAWDLGTLALGREEVLAFASRYDPQYFHLDAEAARESLFGELVASGLHTLSAVFGHVIRSGLITGISIGGNRIDSQWPAPLRPDEEIAVRAEVAEIRPSRSGRRLGVAKMRYTARRVADGVVVLDAVVTHFLRR